MGDDVAMETNPHGHMGCALASSDVSESVGVSHVARCNEFP